MSNSFFVKGIYASGMVLQRNTVNCIYGGGAKATQVELEFRGNKSSTTADKNGEWKIEFNPGEAGGPFDLKLACASDTIVFSDVYVGEVWLSSGQSNAQLPMNRMKYSYPEEFKLPENPQIRMITIPITFSFDGEKSAIENPVWKCASPENLGEMSGTAYFFAKKLQKELGIPVGVINSSQGGSPIFAWMNKDSFKELGRDDYLAKIEKWNVKGAVKKVQDEAAAAHKTWDEQLAKSDIGFTQKWNEGGIEKFYDCANGNKTVISTKTFSIPGDFTELGETTGVVWFKKEIVLNSQQAEYLNSHKSFIWFGTIQDSDTIWINGTFCGSTGYLYPPRRYEIPKGTLKEGSNIITVRVQKNGPGPIRFFTEKPYYLFSEDVRIAPVAFRNVERVELQNQVQSNSSVHKDDASAGVKIKLEGEWNYAVGCTSLPRPGEVFFEWEPSALYNSMLAPCFSYAIAGALWYQGESNATEYYDYKALLKKMIELWRKKFVYAPEKMPFVVMQLPNWAIGIERSISDNFDDWAELRDAQLKAVEESDNTTLVSMIDAGEWNDLHPEKKKTGGTRAALEALRLAYGAKTNAAPKIEYCERKDDVFTLRFNCGTSSLKAYEVIGEDNDKAKYSSAYADFNKENPCVYGFEFVTKDDVKLKACGKLVSANTVEIKSPVEADSLKELRYLWKNNPWIVNLYSEELIPALPFKILL